MLSEINVALVVEDHVKFSRFSFLCHFPVPQSNRSLTVLFISLSAAMVNTLFARHAFYFGLYTKAYMGYTPRYVSGLADDLL
jgi:hypothetical protein